MKHERCFDLGDEEVTQRDWQRERGMVEGSMESSSADGSRRRGWLSGRLEALRCLVKVWVDEQ
jgi:hypothetical protein